MSKNLRTLICSILAIVLVSSTMLFVFAGSESAFVKNECASEIESEVVSEVASEAADEDKDDNYEDEDVSVSEDVSENLGTEYLIGDLDLNGKITAYDARLAIRIAAKLDTYTQLQFTLANTNGDERITAADARNILRVAAKLDPMFSTIVIY